MGQSSEQPDGWTPLHLDGPLQPPAAIGLSESEEGVAAQTAMGALKAAVDQRADHDLLRISLDNVRDRLDTLNGSGATALSGLARVRMSLRPSIPPSGFESPTVQRLVVSLGGEDAPVALGLAFFRRTERGG